MTQLSPNLPLNQISASTIYIELARTRVHHWLWDCLVQNYHLIIPWICRYHTSRKSESGGLQNPYVQYFPFLLWMFMYQPDWVGLRAKTGVAVKCSVGILILEQHFEQTVCLHIWHFCPRERENRPKRVDIQTKHIRPRSTSYKLTKIREFYFL